MIIRSKAPLRLGFAGGGSDVSPYSDLYGGLILNATINMYAYCTIEETKDGKIEIIAPDIQTSISYPMSKRLPVDGCLDLHKGVYNRIVEEYRLQPMSFRITTYSDAPPGSGLGSSSTMVVAIVKAFVEWLNLPLGEYEIAYLAYQIERKDLQLSGGKQDQYAAAFGGFNFMEFQKNDVVIVNPLRVKRWIVDELESSLVLYYTGASRSSAAIIDEQKRRTSSGNADAIEAMHRIRQSSIDMKTALLRGDVSTFAAILGEAWEDKKKMASAITNPMIQQAFDVAIDNGAVSGKVSGAGGGGFIMFMVEPTKKVQVTNELSKLVGRVVGFQFSEGGCHGWKIYN
ncbi:MAG: dehydrogenase [Prevotella sp.]|jgi:D-glycero-alpha-D-manno-heptose-7-phosphate kinase|nr:dehydrogenase [Prevotella sp.]